MASVGQVADRIRQIAGSLPDETVLSAGDLLDEAGTVFFQATDGSYDDASRTVLELHRVAREQVDHVLRTCVEIRARILALADRLSGPAPIEPLVASTGVTAEVRRDGPKLIEDIRRGLSKGRPETPAQGRWISDDEVVEITSGTSDEWYEAAREFINSRFSGVDRPVMRLATHIEVKLAVRMWRENRTDETVVIDRTVCGRRPWDTKKRFTCDRYLGRLLPLGASLTVVQHDGSTVTYRGQDS